MTHHKLKLKKNGPSDKYTWQQKMQIHLAIAKAKYGKHFIDDPSKAAELVAKEQVLDYNNDVGYYGPATLGGQKFEVLFDTGSSDLWVPQVGYNNGAPSDHNVFDPNNSPTYKTNNVPFSITYGSGHTSGTAATDTFKISEFTITNQAFGLADTVSDDFKDSPFDGILGMGFTKLSSLGANTPFDNLVAQQDVTSPVFGFVLGRAKDGGSSELILGGVDPKYASSIRYNKVINQIGFWQINLDDAKVDNKPLNLHGRSAIIDTGTTLVLIPPSDAKKLHDKIPGSKVGQDGSYLIPSNNTSVVSLTFGGVSYDINPKDLAFYDAGNGYFVSGIQGGNLPGMGNTWLVGDVFLKNVFNAYDVKQRAVGFAPI